MAFRSSLKRFRVAILYSDRDEKDKNGSDIMDGDRLVLKGANLDTTCKPKQLKH